MLRSFNDENDERLKTIGWLKIHIDEFNDSDKILVLDAKHESVMMQIFNSCKTEEELDKEEEIELSAAKIAWNMVVNK